MRNVRVKVSTCRVILLPVLCLLCAATATSAHADNLRALSGGKVDFYLRFRFENVHDDQLPPVKNASANTLRTALGYQTGRFYNFVAYLQFEDVRAICNELYNDGDPTA